MKLPSYLEIGYIGPRWVAFYYLIDWHLWALGVSVDVKSPNVELHLGPGFFRIGRASHYQPNKPHQLGVFHFDGRRGWGWRWGYPYTL